MPLPDGYLPREGDVLIVHVVAKYNVDPGDADVHANVVGVKYRDIVVPLDHVVGLHCRHWEVGAKVWIRHDKKNPATVIGVDEDRVWVKFSTAGGYATYSANDLTEAAPDVGPKDFGLPETTPPAAPNTPADDMPF